MIFMLNMEVRACWLLDADSMVGWHGQLVSRKPGTDISGFRPLMTVENAAKKL